MQYKKGIFYEGEIVGVYRSEMKNTLESAALNTIEVDEKGIVGDKHNGILMKSDARQTAQYTRGTVIRNNRQWSAVSVEELVEVSMKMGIEEIKPEWLGANLLIKGIPNLTKLPPLSMIIIRPDSKDKTVLINYFENFPCAGPQKKIIERIGFEPNMGFVPAAMGKRGLVGWVEKSGKISVGDSVKVLIPV